VRKLKRKGFLLPASQRIGMKVCIYGAGAIGGYLGVQLARAGADVSLVARGAHLAAMRENGLALLIGDERHIERLRCTDDPGELGVQDFVIICLKAHSIPQGDRPDAAAARAAQPHRHCSERHSLLVFL
jgi:2-polyprenyl-6-methoxyphenol hydroxylase-like FAD-dependent oxidoreductase